MLFGVHEEPPMQSVGTRNRPQERVRRKDVDLTTPSLSGGDSAVRRLPDFPKTSYSDGWHYHRAGYCVSFHSVLPRPVVRGFFTSKQSVCRPAIDPFSRRARD